MRAKFRYILHYHVDVECLSPLRTGGVERNTEIILRNHTGVPILQGTSLAGSLRAWKDDSDLWGSPESEGQLIVSDLKFNRTKAITRPRVKINQKTGVVQNKYDLSALPTGTEGNFELIWRGTDNPESAKTKIEEYLSALHSGAISLGAQKSNGFGLVGLRVSLAEYDLKDAKSLEDWLKETKKPTPLYLKQAHTSYILFTVDAETSGLLVKASHESGYGDGSLKGVQIRENITAIIPGSSIKGAIRTHLERIAPYFRAEALIDQYFGRASAKKVEGISGKIRFSDGKFQGNSVAAVRKRIRISRLSGGVFGKSLFGEETMQGHVSWEIRIPDGHPQICALLLFALRDLYLGLYNIGSGFAIGRGQFSKMKVAIQTPDGESEMKCRESGIEMRDPDGIIAAWQSALGGVQP